MPSGPNRRRFLVVLVVAFIALALFSLSYPRVEAQTVLGQRFGRIVVGRSYHNDTSPPLRNLPIVLPGTGAQRENEREANLNPKVRIRHVDRDDTVVQRDNFAPSAPMPSPILNFDGIGFPGVSCNCAPPDTDGEIGATQFVQMVNEGYQVFNKTTGVSVLGPSSIVSLWTGFGGACQNGGAGDPVVFYDQLADRWVITQFASPTNNIPITDECVAVSTTSDATGSYNRYGFHLGSNFFDYPHFGLWPDAYYMSMNVFNASGTSYLGPQPFAFDRARMLAGLSATFVTTAGAGGPSEAPYLPADMDGLITPAVGAPETFVEFPITVGGNLVYKVWHMHADFATPANTTFTLFQSVAAAAFTALCPSTRNCIPQLNGAGTRLDGIGDRPMFRLAYRNFGDHESVFGNYAVNAAGVAGVRWFEMRAVSGGPVTINQESTYSPDTTWRWMASLAQDHQGNMALGYSASSATINPEIRYAGRLVSDAANTLPQTEVTMFSGAGSQTGGLNRWGDYSDMTIDPMDDCTFWYTQEYIPSNGSFNWKTRIGNFKFPGCVAREPGGDFDRDYRTDRSVFRPSTGTWFSLVSRDLTATATGFGTNGDMDVAADYDGDGRADPAVFRPSTGTWFILQSATNTVRTVGFGTNGDIPLAGDVDGDGKADLAVFRPSSGTWFILKSGGGTTIAGFGTTGDQPLLADYDGDGKADLTIFRPGTGTWFIMKSGGGTTVAGWGTVNDVPVTGDWDADGKADLAIFRPSTGAWWISKSTGGTLVVGWGTNADIPIAGDQDGDGKSDYTIWRPTTGAWFSQNSGGFVTIVGFGTNGDMPVGRVPG